MSTTRFGLRLRAYISVLIGLALLVAGLAQRSLAQGNTLERHTTVAQSRIWYVHPDADSTGSGLSAVDAATLQEALRNARVGDEIRVAAGVYVPGPSSSDTFTIRNGVAVLGGFAPDFTERDPTRHVTILSGDIDDDDTNKTDAITPTASDIVGTNTRNVVTFASEVFDGTRLEGVTITGGQAGNFTDNRGGCPATCGGGMYIGRGNSPTIDTVRFIGNQARRTGGGMYVQFGQPILNNLTFVGNHSNEGGGMFMRDSTLTITNVTFEANLARRDGLSRGLGGGLYLASNSNVTLNNATFLRNEVTESGGGIFVQRSTLTMIGGTLTGNTHPLASADGIIQGTGGLELVESSLDLTNVRFIGNVGGGLSLRGVPIGAAPDHVSTLTNISFVGNHFGGDRAGRGPGALTCVGCRLRATNLSIAGNRGGGLAAGGITTGGQNVQLELHNSIIWGNRSTGDLPDPNLELHPAATVTVVHSLIEGQNVPGHGNLDGTTATSDPLFVLQPDAATTPTTAGDLRLRRGSPAIDTGDNTLNNSETDLDGNPRIINGILDLGAYETGSVPQNFRLAPTSDTGISNNDNITSNITPEFLGTANPGSSITLISSLDDVLGTTTADATGAWQLVANTMRDGSHLVIAEIDGTRSAPVGVTIDTRRPVFVFNEQFRDDIVQFDLIFDEPVIRNNAVNVSIDYDRQVFQNVGFSITPTRDRNTLRLTLLHDFSVSFVAGQVAITFPEGFVIDVAGNPSQSAGTGYRIARPLEAACAASGAVHASATLAQDDDLEPLDIDVFYALRNKIMSQSAEGQRQTDLYYTHSLEILRLMLADADLLAQGIDTLRTWQPALRALVNGSGDQVTITTADVQTMTEFLDALVTVGNPELQQAITTERTSLQLGSFVGQTINQATITSIGVDPTELDLGQRVYLPLVVR